MDATKRNTDSRDRSCECQSHRCVELFDDDRWSASEDELDPTHGVDTALRTVHVFESDSFMTKVPCDPVANEIVEGLVEPDGGPNGDRAGLSCKVPRDVDSRCPSCCCHTLNMALSDEEALSLVETVC